VLTSCAVSGSAILAFTVSQAPQPRLDCQCRRRRVCGRPDVQQVMLPPPDQSGQGRTQQRRQPEQPELLDIGAAGEQRRAGAASRVDRCVRDRDEKQMDQRQA
jgi:hypothetical protein